MNFSPTAIAGNVKLRSWSSVRKLSFRSLTLGLTIGVVSFADADPVFAATEHLSTVMLTRPDGTDEEYQDRVREGSGLDERVSSATVPLLDVNCTVGVLGFIKYGDRDWQDGEVNALRAVAGVRTRPASANATAVDFFMTPLS